jgi:hypothetical protein
MSESNDSSENNEGISKFVVIIKDFTSDFFRTFPEYLEKSHEGIKDIQNGKTESNSIDELWLYCKNLYPERFFDFLYQNDAIFTDADINSHFLPNIDFKEVWKQDISENTRNIIWKYLQLICFSVVNGEKTLESFGDTTKLFEAIGEEELKKKLEEAMENMANLFDLSGVCGESEQTDASVNSLPNPDELHEHISALMNGKLGRLASEITEETLKDFTDLSGISSVGDVFQKLFKNPGKLMNMVQKLGDSLDSKIKSGEIKESELMQEAADIMKKLQSVPGMKNMKDLFGKMGMEGLGGLMGKNSKLNMGAMQGHLAQNTRKAKQRDRMRAKLAAKREMKKDIQIELLQKQLEAAKKTNQVLEGMDDNAKPKKMKRKKKRRKARNKK